MKRLYALLVIAITMLLQSHIALANTQLQLRWASEASYPPFEFIAANGQMQGFDIDIAHALCQQMQVKCSFSNIPWESLIPSLKLGKYDMLIGSMAITPERQLQVDFTNSYYQNTASFIAPKKSGLTISPEGLKGKTIGVQGGTTFANYLYGVYNNALRVNNYASQQEAFLDLKSGRVDAVLADTPVAKQWLKEAGNQDYAVAGQPINNPQYFGPGNGIAVKKGNTELLTKLNAALAAIKANGVYHKILQTWFGS